MTESDPILSVSYEVRAGRATLNLTMPHEFLDMLLQFADVHSISDLTPVNLQALCAQFAPDQTETALLAQEMIKPGSVQITNNESGMPLGSDYLGFDVAARMNPLATKTLVELFDTTASPVGLRLYVIGESSPTDGRLPKSLLLDTVVGPPSFE